MQTIGFQPKTTSQKRTVNTKPPLPDPTYPHTAVIGQTGSGKTTGVILPNIGYSIDQNHAVVVYDFKGNLGPKVKYLAQKANRLDDVVELGYPWSPSINMIDGVSLTDVSKMLENAISMDRGVDGFWIDNAISIAMPLLKTLRAFQRLKRLSGHNIENFLALVESSFHTFPSLLTVYQETLTLSRLKRLYGSCNAIIDNCKLALTETERAYLRGDPDALDAFLRFVDALQQCVDQYAKFDDIDKTSSKTINSVLMTLHGGLRNIGLEKAFHDGEEKIGEMMDNGKIVIINLSNLGDGGAAYISRSMFEHFRRRFGQKNPRPVTIFMDEMQRILHPSFDLPIDILRESRVEIVAAFQSPEILINKIGHVRYESLMTNFTTKIYLKGRENLGGFNTSELETFEYFHSRDNYRVKRKITCEFLPEKEVFLAEHRFQKSRGILARHPLKRPPNQPYCLVYIPNEYEEGRIRVDTLDGGTSIEAFIIPKARWRRHLERFDALVGFSKPEEVPFYTK